jgi:hypothetical protein
MKEEVEKVKQKLTGSRNNYSKIFTMVGQLLHNHQNLKELHELHEQYNNFEKIREDAGKDQNLKKMIEANNVATTQLNNLKNKIDTVILKKKEDAKRLEKEERKRQALEKLAKEKRKKEEREANIEWIQVGTELSGIMENFKEKISYEMNNDILKKINNIDIYYKQNKGVENIKKAIIDKKNLIQKIKQQLAKQREAEQQAAEQQAAEQKAEREKQQRLAEQQAEQKRAAEQQAEQKRAAEQLRVEANKLLKEMDGFAFGKIEFDYINQIKGKMISQQSIVDLSNLLRKIKSQNVEINKLITKLNNYGVDISNSANEYLQEPGSSNDNLIKMLLNKLKEETNKQRVAQQGRQQQGRQQQGNVCNGKDMEEAYNNFLSKGYEILSELRPSRDIVYDGTLEKSFGKFLKFLEEYKNIIKKEKSYSCTHPDRIKTKKRIYNGFRTVKYNITEPRYYNEVEKHFYPFLETIAITKGNLAYDEYNFRKFKFKRKDKLYQEGEVTETNILDNQSSSELLSDSSEISSSVKIKKQKGGGKRKKVKGSDKINKLKFKLYKKLVDKNLI